MSVNRITASIVGSRKSFLSFRGTCVGVQFAADGVHVAVLQRGRALVWLTREAVMTEDELHVWVRGGRPAPRPGTDGRLK